MDQLPVRQRAGACRLPAATPALLPPPPATKQADAVGIWCSQGCELPHFGRIVLQPIPGDDAERELVPYFVLSSRAKQRHGLKQAKAELLGTKRMHVAKVNHAAIATACGLERDVVTTGIKELLWCLLEAMANRPDCLLDVGVGDIRANFTRPANSHQRI